MWYSNVETNIGGYYRSGRYGSHFKADSSFADSGGMTRCNSRYIYLQETSGFSTRCIGGIRK